MARLPSALTERARAQRGSEEIEDLIATVASRLRSIARIKALVLGGSRARGTHDARSDIDLGLYYDSRDPFSLDALGAAARELDDEHREGLVTPFGAWGPGVNGGGW